jgi:hypothetical protein
MEKEQQGIGGIGRIKTGPDGDARGYGKKQFLDPGREGCSKVAPGEKDEGMDFRPIPEGKGIVLFFHGRLLFRKIASWYGIFLFDVPTKEKSRPF